MPRNRFSRQSARSTWTFAASAFLAPALYAAVVSLIMSCGAMRDNEEPQTVRSERTEQTEGKKAAVESVPSVRVEVGPVSGSVKDRTIHGWHSSRLVMYGGALYAAATLPDETAANNWKDKGVIYRPEPDGNWTEAGILPNQPYHLMVDPRGRFWVIAPSDYRKCEVFRSQPGADLSRWELEYNGTCAYTGGSVSPEGNVLIMHSEHNEKGPIAVTAAFYDAATDKWTTSAIDTPDWRYGYEAIILQGRRAMAVLNSSAVPPPEGAPKPEKPVISFWGMDFPPEAAPWRNVRLAACNDLTKGEWKQKHFINHPWGSTGLADAYAASDGYL